MASVGEVLVQLGEIQRSLQAVIAQGRQQKDEIDAAINGLSFVMRSSVELGAMMTRARMVDDRISEVITETAALESMIEQYRMSIG